MDQDLRDRYRMPPRDYAAPLPRPQMPPEVLPPPRPAQPQSKPTDLRPAVRFNRPAPLPAPSHDSLPEAAIQTARPRQKAGRKRLIFTVFLMILIIAAAGGLFYRQHRPKPSKSAALAAPLPAAISAQVNFPVYYPLPTPDGYTYQTGTAAVQSGLVFFKLFNGSKFVFFTEQAKPAKPVDLSALAGYSQLPVPAGSAAVGTSLGRPSGLVLSGSTLINVSTSGGVTAGELDDIFKSLTPINK